MRRRKSGVTKKVVSVPMKKRKPISMVSSRPVIDQLYDTQDELDSLREYVRYLENRSWLDRLLNTGVWK